jgi:hypothetical protein
MYMVDYCVIQFSKQQIVASGIDRQLRAGCGDHLAEQLVPCLDGLMPVVDNSFSYTEMTNTGGDSESGTKKVPLSDRALERLKARCWERREGWIFPAFSASGHLTTVDKKFRQARLEAGLPEKLVLHCGRHDYGTRVLQGTGNLAVVMRTWGTGVINRNEVSTSRT